MSTRFASFAFLCAFALNFVRAAEPFLKPNDVIALVGGEDMMAASEYGYLELLLQRALPGHHLKVRSLAWEGDTVFEQPRDLNYPTLEAQLDEVGATVVIMQFGQMESLAGTSKLPEFIKAYEKLIERVSAGGKRRVVVMAPPSFESGPGIRPVRWSDPVLRQLSATHHGSVDYSMAVRSVGKQSGRTFVSSPPPPDAAVTGDGVHENEFGQANRAASLTGELVGHHVDRLREDQLKTEERRIVELIRAKNRLWFHYYRPQNWAFLAGDRTEQPSSRDHKDPSKRWFPEEMKQWLPLIDAKEKEIWALAAKSAKP